MAVRQGGQPESLRLRDWSDNRQDVARVRRHDKTEIQRGFHTRQGQLTCNGHLIITEFKVGFLLGSPLHRENRETKKEEKKKSPVSENTGNSEMLPKFREAENLSCSSCKFPHSRDKVYCYIRSKNFFFFPLRNWIHLPRQLCISNS